VEPWLSSVDIAKGANWSAELSRQLKASQFAVLCLDQSNVGQHWVNFEAGALAASMSENRIAPLLFGGLRPQDLTGPLQQFQVTVFGKAEVKRLVKSIATAGSGSADNRISVSGPSWAALKNKIDRIKFPQGPVDQDTGQLGRRARIPPAERRVLSFIAEVREESDFQAGVNPVEIATDSGISVTKAEYHLNRLAADRLVRADQGLWDLTEDGVAYVIEKGLA
jgi:hypothetical protein